MSPDATCRPGEIAHAGTLGSVGELYEASHDFPRTLAAPRSSYMIATTQRSGSTLLALHLWRTGGMGAPLEYLRKSSVEMLSRRIGVSNCSEYWRALRSLRTSPNSVFGFKAFASHIKDCGRFMPELLGACLPPIESSIWRGMTRIARRFHWRAQRRRTNGYRSQPRQRKLVSIGRWSTDAGATSIARSPPGIAISMA